MKNTRLNKFNLAGFAGLLMVLGAPSLSVAQVTLIDSSTRNGSFEEGVLSPWNSGEFSVMHDPDFATNGAWLAVVSSIAFSPSVRQNLTPDPGQGLSFLLAFDARAGTPGYTFVSTQMTARTPEGASLSAIVTPILAPTLSPEAWQAFEYELEIPAAWNQAGITFSISFTNNVVLDGVTHFAYLDNVVLHQVPEPTAWTLLAGGLCGVCIGVRLFRKRWNEAGSRAKHVTFSRAGSLL